MLSRLLWAYTACTATCALLASCTLFDGKGVKTELSCDPKDPMCLCDPMKNPACPSAEGGVSGVGSIGKDCLDDTQCMGTLRLGCIDGVCTLTADLSEGSSCNVTGECDDGLYCAVERDRTCAKAGDAKAGTRCATTGQCQRGLVCAYTGFTQKCVASGTGDVGAACGSTSDCLAGLLCPPPSTQVTNPFCVPTPDLDKLRPVVWSGLACEADEGGAKSYFHVPRGDSSDKDFYRLPFPNDVRRKNGRLDLGGFPSPGNLLGIGDLVGNYIKAAERDLTGFATNPVVYFRFSKPYAGNSVGESSVLLYDIDPASPGYGRAVSRSWGTSSGDISAYICENWLNVRTGMGSPLAPNTTYAVVLTSGITTKEGGSFARDADLDALLAADAPGDAALAAAHAAYAPLRAFMAAGKLASNDVLNAAVFTTQSPEDLITELHDVIAGSAAPLIKNLTVCDSGVKSPCDDGAERVCDAASADHVEVHGRITLPIFQNGSAPYLTQGGSINLDAAGTPSAVRDEDVCFGLTLPKTPAPQAGYPLVIYGHGTGGSFKSGLRDLAGTATAAGAAVLTIDLPQHGSRKGGSDLGSDELFFNFLNPDAALGNVAQGSADLMSLVAWAKSVNEDAGSAFGQAVRFDAQRIAMFGHSQGATHTSLMLPQESVSGAVLSGLGGDLSEALATKKSPIDISRAMPILLADPTAAPFNADTCKTCLGSNHPAYALLQAFFERVDPVNFGAGLTKLPQGGSAKHVFMTYGLGDTYAPEATQKAYVVSANLPHVGTELTALYKTGSVPAPQASNVMVGAIKVSQGVIQYMPKAGEDGHFVYLGAGKADWQRFLTGVLKGTPPQIGN